MHSVPTPNVNPSASANTETLMLCVIRNVEKAACRPRGYRASTDRSSAATRSSGRPCRCPKPISADLAGGSRTTARPPKAPPPPLLPRAPDLVHLRERARDQRFEIGNQIRVGRKRLEPVQVRRDRAVEQIKPLGFLQAEMRDPAGARAVQKVLELPPVEFARLDEPFEVDNHLLDELPFFDAQIRVEGIGTDSRGVRDEEVDTELFEVATDPVDLRQSHLSRETCVDFARVAGRRLLKEGPGPGRPEVDRRAQVLGAEGPQVLPKDRAVRRVAEVGEENE